MTKERYISEGGGETEMWRESLNLTGRLWHLVNPRSSMVTQRHAFLRLGSCIALHLRFQDVEIIMKSLA